MGGGEQGQGIFPFPAAFFPPCNPRHSAFRAAAPLGRSQLICHWPENWPGPCRGKAQQLSSGNSQKATGRNSIKKGERAWGWRSGRDPLPAVSFLSPASARAGISQANGHGRTGDGERTGKSHLAKRKQKPGPADDGSIRPIPFCWLRLSGHLPLRTYFVSHGTNNSSRSANREVNE
jgi:hypothetical protein